MSTNGEDHIDLRTVMDGVNAAVNQALGHQRQITLRPATVSTVSPDQTLVELEIDGATAVTAGDDTVDHDSAVGAQVLAPTVFAGDRVMVMFVPPAGAFVVGRRGGDFDEWHVVGEEEEPPFAAGWANYGTPAGLFEPGWPPAMFRRIGRWVELRGRVTRTSGSSWIIFTLPDGYRPANHVALPVLTGSGNSYSVSAITVTPEGVVLISSGYLAGQAAAGTFLAGVFSVDELPLDMTENVGPASAVAPLSSDDTVPPEPFADHPLPRHDLDRITESGQERSQP